MSEIDMSLLPDFIVEAGEHLEEMESMLLQLVQQPDNRELLNDIFRPIHTIKGGAQYIGLEQVSRLAHRLEDLLDLLRAGSKSSSIEIVDTLIASRDRIAKLVDELSTSASEESPVDDLIEVLTRMIEEDTTGVSAASTGTTREIESSLSTTDHPEQDDEELFAIFIDHLRQHYSELLSLVHELPQSSDKQAHLLHAVELIDGLHSSANYMDYGDLLQIYQSWVSEIEDAIDELARGNIPSFDFMAPYLAELKDRFPQIEGTEPSKYSTGDLEQAQPSMETAAGGDVTDTVMQAFANMEGSDVSEPAATADESTPSSEIELSLLPDFIIEAKEHLEEMEAMLLQLVQQPDNLELLNDIFRPTHTIKGGAQYIGLEKVSRLAHRLEDLLDLLREGSRPSSSAIVDTLIAARDRIARLVDELSTSNSEQSSIDDLVDALTRMIEGEESAAPATTESREKITSTAATYREEEDEELFEIFMKHLQQRYTELSSIYRALKAQSGDSSELLNRAVELISALRSSANYMDYIELVQRYQMWNTEIRGAIDSLAGGGAPSLDFMERNLSELHEIFPQLAGDLAATDEDSDQIRVVINEPVAGGLEDTLSKKETDDRSASVKEKAPTDELYNDLANALDASLNLGSIVDDYQNLQQIFDELVSETAAPETPTQVASSKKAVRAERAEKAVKTKKEQKSTETESKIKKSVRVDADKIDTLMNQVGELVVDRSYFFQLFSEMRDLQRHLKETLGLEQKEVKLLRNFTYRLSEAIAALGRTSNDLQEGVMKMRMLPISQIFNRYPRLVHDLTRNSDKRVKLVVKGEDTELDRMIVEELSDPLVHIIRNAIDHGIESSSERAKVGKPEEGTLILEAYQESNQIVIEVTDDGRGIDPEKIRVKAQEKGLFTHDELSRLGSDELIPLILTAGFSTAEKITGTSGRGVGMDVVKKNIEKLNGTLEIDSKHGIGTQIRLKIPLTLAIIHALMVRVSGDLFTIPLANVDETVRVYEKDTSVVEGVEVIHLRGQTLPIFRLSTLFNSKTTSDIDKSFVVIVSVGGQRTGFVVDELLGQEEVVIKPLADYVQEKSGFSGATIIGDGRISLILDVYELVRMTANKQARKHQKQMEELKSRIRRRGSKVKQDA